MFVYKYAKNVSQNASKANPTTKKLYIQQRGIYLRNATANIILNDTLKAFPLRSGA
jgi:hypothetical protein